MYTLHVIHFKWIPSPSIMKWEDLSRVLVGSIPKFKNIDDLPKCDDAEKEDLKSQYHTTDEMVSKVSEGDASQRVFTVLLSLFQIYKKGFLVKCETCVKDHPKFTDYLIEITTTDGGECIIVEIKTFSVNCDLNAKGEEVAQVLRQA